MDTVFVRDLSVCGKHGVGEAERRAEQEFLIDIEAQCDTNAGARSDDIADAVDYVRFVDIANRVVTGNTFYLIERLAHRIADEILLDERIVSVRVKIRKPAVLHSGVPGIVIERKR